jgi:mono/diheme cytochrome c family protein
MPCGIKRTAAIKELERGYGLGCAVSSIRAMKGLIVENERRVGHLKSGLQTVLVGGLVGAAAFGLAKLRTKFMRLFLLGFFSAFALIIVAGFACIELGLAPVATSSPPLPFERLITGIALDARVGKEAPTSSPIQPSEDVYFAGAKIYENNCAVCHGLPGQEQTPSQGSSAVEQGTHKPLVGGSIPPSGTVPRGEQCGRNRPLFIVQDAPRDQVEDRSHPGWVNAKRCRPSRQAWGICV